MIQETLLISSPVVGGVAAEIVSHLWFRRRAEDRLANQTADTIAQAQNLAALLGKNERRATDLSLQLGVDTYLYEQAHAGLVGTLTHAGGTILAIIGAVVEFQNAEPVLGYGLTCLALSYLFGVFINVSHWREHQGTQDIKNIR